MQINHGHNLRVAYQETLGKPASEMDHQQLHNTVVKIRNVHSGHLLDVENYSQEEGGNVWLWDDTYQSDNYQGWLLNPIIFADGTLSSNFYIISLHSGKLAVVKDDTTRDGGNVEQSEFSTKRSQEWQFEKVDNQSDVYRIKSAFTGKYLDINLRNQANKGNVHQWRKTDTTNQHWVLEHVDKPTKTSDILGTKPIGPIPTIPANFSDLDLERSPDLSFQGSAAIPFYLIHDPEILPSKQAQHSPYYVLEREMQCFIKPEWIHHNNTPDLVEFEVTTGQGWSKAIYQSFTNLIRFNIGASVHGIIASTARELNYANEDELTTYSEKRVMQDCSISPNCTGVLWNLQSLLTLRRMDGTYVDSWKQNGPWSLTEYSSV